MSDNSMHRKRQKGSLRMGGAVSAPTYWVLAFVLSV